MTHVARGLDSEGVLLIDIGINGFVPPSLSSSHLSLQVGSLLSSQCVFKDLKHISTESLLTYLSYLFNFSGLISFASCRSLMSHMCRQAKGSCTRGHRRPTREEETPWCCAVITRLFMRARRSARALCSSCSRSPG